MLKLVESAIPATDFQSVERKTTVGLVGYLTDKYDLVPDVAKAIQELETCGVTRSTWCRS